MYCRGMLYQSLFVVRKADFLIPAEQLDGEICSSMEWQLIRERMKTSHIVLRSVFLVAVYESMRCCWVYMGKYRSFDSLSTNMHAFWMYLTTHHTTWCCLLGWKMHGNWIDPSLRNNHKHQGSASDDTVLFGWHDSPLGKSKPGVFGG